MNRLLISNLVRLRKNIFFWLSLICAMVGPLYTVINNFYYKTQWDNITLSADNALVMIGEDYFYVIALAIIISLFIGTEYSDKTIRSKIIAGHSRLSIFLANISTSVLIAIIMYLMAVISACVGIPLLDKFEMPLDKLIMQMGFAIISVSVMAVFFCTVTMIIGNRVVSVIVSMLTVIGLQMIPPFLWSNIDIFREYGLLDTFRAKLYAFLYDLIPTCQIYQYTNVLEELPKNIYLFPVYSVLLIVVLGTIGCLCFKKKNLK